MSIKKILSTLLLIAAAAPLGSQQTRKLTPDAYSDYGLVYRLPVTVLDVEIEVRHTVERPGPFMEYARRYVGGDARIITADAERWEVVDVRVQARGAACDTMAYRMQLKAGVPTFITVASDGMLLAINRQTDAPALWEEPDNPLPLAVPPVSGYLKYMGEDFLMSRSSAKRAEMLARSIMEVREARLSLTRGTAETMPTDGRQLELMLQSLANQEQLMTEAFTGTTVSETRRARFTFTPAADGRFVLARISGVFGPVAPDDLSGSPVYINVKTVSAGKVPVDEKGEPMKAPRNGVAYRVPGTALITLDWDGTEFFSREIQLSQLGVTFYLDPALFTARKAPSYATFDPATGAIVEIGKTE